MKTTLKCGELSLVNRAQAVSILQQAARALEEDLEVPVETLFYNLVSVQMWLLEAAHVHFDKGEVPVPVRDNDSVSTSCGSALAHPIKYKLY